MRKQLDNYDYSALSSSFFAPLIKKAIELISPAKIILFGSFARGDFHAKSDIDLAFDFTKKQQEWVEFKLWANEEFTTLRDLDLIDLMNVDENIRESVLKEGKLLYERKG